MEFIEILGYFGALLMGVVLGLVGSGGSILTVPILVYFFAVNPISATAYSLFAVGTTSLVGAINNVKKQLIDFRTAIVFSIPAFIAVYITRKYIISALPENLFSIAGITITKDIGIMLFFAIIMILAAISMIIERKTLDAGKVEVKFNYPLILIEGFVIGILTGLVGAGGGFLIIPALVLLAKLPMKKAVATSLLIIAVKSLIGFIGDIENLEIEWLFLLIFTGISVLGIFLGIYLGKFIPGRKLKKGFGYFVLVMGLYIIWKETWA